MSLNTPPPETPAQKLYAMYGVYTAKWAPMVKNYVESPTAHPDAVTKLGELDNQLYNALNVGFQILEDGKAPAEVLVQLGVIEKVRDELIEYLAKQGVQSFDRSLGEPSYTAVADSIRERDRRRCPYHDRKPGPSRIVVDSAYASDYNGRRSYRRGLDVVA